MERKVQGKDASGEKGKGERKQPKRKGKGKVTICWNCGKPGHRQADCSSAQVAPAPAVHAAAVAPSPQPIAQVYTSQPSPSTITISETTYLRTRPPPVPTTNPHSQWRMCDVRTLPKKRWFNEASALTKRQAKEPASIEGASPCSASQRRDWISCGLDAPRANFGQLERRTSTKPSLPRVCAETATVTHSWTPRWKSRANVSSCDRAEVDESSG